MSERKDNYKGRDGTRTREPPDRLPYPKPSSDWSETHKEAERLGAPQHSQLTESHLKSDPRTEVEALANELARKQFSQWTAEEIQKAQKILGPEAVALIRDFQEQKRRGY